MDTPLYRMKRDSVFCEVDDLPFHHRALRLKGQHIVINLLHCLRIRIPCPGFEYIRHEHLSLGHPILGSVEIILGELKQIGPVECGDHGQLIQVHSSAGTVMDKFWVRHDGRLTQLTPDVNCVSVFGGNLELTHQAADRFKIMHKIKVKGSIHVCKVVSDCSFI